MFGMFLEHVMLYVNYNVIFNYFTYQNNIKKNYNNVKKVLNAFI